MKIKQGDTFLSIKDAPPFYTKGKEYRSDNDGRITDDQGSKEHWWVDTNTMNTIPSFKEHFTPIINYEAKTPAYYDNTKGSLYKIATERNWNAYLFDIVKRLERGGKKDPLRQEIEKSIVVMQIWLSELED